MLFVKFKWTFTPKESLQVLRLRLFFVGFSLNLNPNQCQHLPNHRQKYQIAWHG